MSNEIEFEAWGGKYRISTDGDSITLERNKNRYTADTDAAARLIHSIIGAGTEYDITMQDMTDAVWKTKGSELLPEPGPDFSIRTYNVLRREGIRTLGELSNKFMFEIVIFRGYGPATHAEVIKMLENAGYPTDRIRNSHCTAQDCERYAKQTLSYTFRDMYEKYGAEKCAARLRKMMEKYQTDM